MSTTRFPKIASGPPPAWLVEHTGRNAHEIGPPPDAIADWEAAGLVLPDVGAMRRYRLDRVRQRLVANDLDAILLYDPLNIRYATDTTNMSIWTMHNEVRYVLVPADGRVIVWEFSHGEFLSAHSEVVDEIRVGISFEPFYVGDRAAAAAERWGAELVEVVDAVSRTGGRRLAVDTLSLLGVRELDRRGVDLVPGHEVMEEARTVKCADEIAAMRCAVHTCETAIAAMRAMCTPGVPELELWSRLQYENFRRGGEWGETRLMSSGARTNPWYHEVSAKPVANGEFLAFDTDMIGPYGMCVDMSRTWLCGDGTPTAAQADVFSRACDMLEHNLALFRPGATYREITDALVYPSVDEFNGYTVMAHGTGLCDEYPSLFTREQWDHTGFDGLVEIGNVISVEAFVGRRHTHGGGEGVKLEEQIVITAAGPERLTNYPLTLN